MTFKDGERTYLLSYQKTYSAKEVEDGETMAGLNPQRPDIVLSISEGGSVYTYLFDAKYRIWTKNAGGVEIDASPRAAIDDMHRYRDAILYRLQKAEIKREIIGAYVLYPGRREPHLCKEYDESIRRENIGAIPLMPGFLDQLERRLTDILDKKTPQSHLAADIPTRGTSVVVGAAFSEAEIVDVEVAGNKWDSQIKDDTVVLTKEQLNGRDPKSVHFVRFVCANRLRMTVKAEFHFRVKATGECTYNLEKTIPSSQS
jgi:hypothetical protein